MSRPIEYKLFGSSQRSEVITAIKVLPPDWTIVAYPPVRTLPQNKRLHWLLGKIVKARIKWADQEWDADGWKNILVSAHARETRGERYDGTADMIAGIHGEPIQMRESTASMSKERLASLITSIEAWMAHQPEFMEHPVDDRE